MVYVSPGDKSVIFTPVKKIIAQGTKSKWRF
jgi:hypothetical protein